MSRAVMQQALEFLSHDMVAEDWQHQKRKDAVCDALRAALAEPEQNPFGDDAERYARKLHEEREAYKALFTEHKPLTEEEIWKCLPPDPDELAFARAIERKHGIGEQT